MSRSQPKRIIVEFDDGLKTEVPFEDLPASLQSEITRQPFASKPSTNPEREKFLLLEWDDGWKEVIQLHENCSDVNRYYVISRVEHVGRLSLNRTNGYPELIEIAREPLNLKKITFGDTFQLIWERSDREGAKTDHFFTLRKESDAYSEIMKTFKQVAHEEGIDLVDLNSKSYDLPKEQYEKIRQKMGLKAGIRQQDVLDFIACLIKTAL